MVGAFHYTRLIGGVFTNGLEAIVRRVVAHQFALGDVEVPAMQMHRAGRDALEDPGIVIRFSSETRMAACSQARACKASGSVGSSASTRSRAGFAHPFADEFATRSSATHQGVDSAALAMTKYGDVLNLQQQHGELQRRRHAGENRRPVHTAAPGWLHCAPRTDRPVPRQSAGPDPYVIGAGHDENLWTLPLPKLLEQFPFFAEVFFLEVPETSDELGNVFHDMRSEIRLMVSRPSLFTASFLPLWVCGVVPR